jgi:hypothetical protein
MQGEIFLDFGLDVCMIASSANIRGGYHVYCKKDTDEDKHHGFC